MGGIVNPGREFTVLAAPANCAASIVKSLASVGISIAQFNKDGSLHASSIDDNLDIDSMSPMN